jgi:HAAS
MDMLDRYLAEVQRNLPRDHAPDIIDEIGDDIRSQIEERESALSRPLTSDEEADVLRAYGNPKVVASRYAKAQYLIGPQLLPFYWYGLRLAFAIVLGLEILAGAVASIALGKVSPLFIAIDAVWHSAIYIFGIVTIIFVLIERFGGRRVAEKLGRWNPRTLPAPSATPPVSRVGAGFEFLSNIFMLLIALSVLRGGLNRFVVPPYMLTEAWRPLFVATIISTGIVALGALIAYIRPTLGPAQLLARLLGHGALLVGFGLTLRSGIPPITASAGSVSAGTLLAINTMVTISFIVVMVVAAVAAAATLWKLIRATTRGGSSDTTSALAL